MKVKRRTFLRCGIATAGAITGCAGRQPATGLRYFTEAEAKTVEAICEQIIPADQHPGAKQAGVLRFIDIQLTRHYRKHRAAYTKGIDAVNTAAVQASGKPFADLAFAQQTQILSGIENSSKPFFDLISAHTMQGFYGDPRHGGNREMASWKMLGLPEPPVRGRTTNDRKAG